LVDLLVVTEAMFGISNAIAISQNASARRNSGERADLHSRSSGKKIKM
jgi:hypothetical protein